LRREINWRDAFPAKPFAVGSRRRPYGLAKCTCDVAAMVETMPLERAAEAYARMMSGQARFRMVLTMT
jgi:hypothetical protein